MPRFVALDLGAHAVKASVYLHSGRRSELEGHYAQPVPQDGSELPGLAERLVALDELVAAHPEWTNPANEIVLVWPAELVSVRQLDLPFSDRAQVDKTLPFAIEGEVPFDLDDMLLAWRPLPVEEGTRAFVVLAREAQLANWLAALAQRGLDPRRVHLDGEVLGRWAAPDEVVALVDVGHTHTVVSVAAAGRVVSVRSVDVGGREFTRAIQGALDVPYARAEELKHGGEAETDGDIDRLPPPARDAVNAAMALLLAEVRSTLIAVEDELGLEVRRIALSGGGGRLRPLASYLAEDLGVPLTRISDEDGAPVPPTHATSFAAVLLAVRGSSRDRVLDLRVGDLGYRGGVNVLRGVMVYGSAALAFFLVATLVLFVVQFRSLAAEQAQLDGRIRAVVTASFPDVPAASIRDSTTAMAIMSERTTEVVTRSEILAEASAVPPTIDKLRDLTRGFPAPEQVRVEVSELKITPATISFTAETDSYASAAAVEESLQEVDRFSEAAKSGDRKVRDKVSFSMSIPLAASTDEEDG